MILFLNINNIKMLPLKKKMNMMKKKKVDLDFILKILSI